MVVPPEAGEMGTQTRELRDFLLEAELDHYYNAFKNELKIASVPQIKYVAEEDLTSIGESKFYVDTQVVYQLFWVWEQQTVLNIKINS